MDFYVSTIVIDPFRRIVYLKGMEPFDSSGSLYHPIRDTVFARQREQGEEPGLLEAVNLGGGVAAYVDEEGVLTDWDKQAFFRLGHGDKSITLAGVTVLVGTNSEGDDIDCPVSERMVKHMVAWLDPKDVRIPAPVMTSFNGDGTEEVTYLAGTAEWTYDNRPA